MLHIHSEKPYKIKWLDAERDLALRGFPLKASRPIINLRGQIGMSPIVSPAKIVKQ
jgi:hypothetical protein